MPEITDVSLMATNFKCFAEPAQGFEKIRPVNVIIGRNNSGKSTLLDLVAVAFGGHIATGDGHRGSHADVYIEYLLSARQAEQLSNSTIEVSHQGQGWDVRLKDWTNQAIRKGTACPRYSVKTNNPEVIDHPAWLEHKAAGDIQRRVSQILIGHVRQTVQDYRVFRLVADRDVEPEKVTGESVNSIGNDGKQATHIVHDFISGSDRNADLIETEVLREVNVIFAPDSQFDRILTQYHRSSGLHEIYATEANKGRIPLSRMGSGFKTVLLVVLHFLVLPKVGEEGRPEKIIYLFEELENNLHPSLQRRLFLWIRKQALELGYFVFVTTHSTAVIDIFADDENAQILHVEHDGVSATVSTAADFEDGLAVLSDLGVKASDILQANAVLWVEGPSDRIYLNKWIELWSEGELTEGVHYQCVWFGGSLNAHVSLNDPDEDELRMQALRVNRNAALLIDRDRDNETESLKIHTQRLIDEVENHGGFAWLTDGREVENYIPIRVIRELLGKSTLKGPTSKYGKMIPYLKNNGLNGAKTVIARKVVEILSKSDLETHLDLAEQLEELCNRIRKWNHMQ